MKRRRNKGSNYCNLILMVQIQKSKLVRSRTPPSISRYISVQLPALHPQVIVPKTESSRFLSSTSIYPHSKLFPTHTDLTSLSSISFSRELLWCMDSISQLSSCSCGGRKVLELTACTSLILRNSRPHTYSNNVAVASPRVVSIQYSLAKTSRFHICRDRTLFN